MADNPNEDDNLLDAWRRRIGDDEPRVPETHSPNTDSPDTQSASTDSASTDSASTEPNPDETAEWRDDQLVDETAEWNPDETEHLAADDAPTATFDADETTEQPVAAPPAYIPESDAAKDSTAKDHADDDRAGDSTDEDEPVKKKRRWPFVLFMVVLLLGAGYVGAAYALQDRMPSGLTVSGVPVGGMTEQEAYEAVETGLAADLQNPREVTTAEGDATEQVNPAAINLAVDLDETFDGLTGFSLHPMKLWAQVSGGSNIDAKLVADDAALATEVDRLAEAFAQEPTDAELAISDANVNVQPAQEGVSIVKDESQAVIVDDWLAGDAPIQLPTETVEPEISTEELETFAADTIEPLLAGPISITIKDVMVELEPAQTGSLLSVANEGDAPELSVDQDGLEGIIEERAGEVLGTPTDAIITISGGAPVITPSENGESLDIEQISTALLGIAEGTDRTVVADIIVEEPEFTTEDAEEMGITEVVSSISTPLTADSVRTTNLVVGTSKVTNVLIKPGEQFNLGDQLGPVDAEHGFVSSGVVTNGFNSTAMGGGLSQLSTNMFNIGYRAGMEDISHQPHSKYFSRYPAGLEATIWGDQIPMIWENNTPYGVMIEAWVADGQVHSRLWSTKYWDVDVWQSERFAFRDPETRENLAADCVPSAAGASGFSITVGRNVSLNGELENQEQYTWTYEPVHAVTCG